MSAFKPTYLYIKTHNITGLKYFGKTNQKNPYKYKGSGKRWLNHLKVHGNNVSTEILGVFTDENWIMFYAYEFSHINTITSSKEWANLVDESGVQGGFNSENFDIDAHLKGRETRRLAGTGIDFNKESQKLGQITATKMKVGYLDPKNYMRGVKNSILPDAIERRKQTYKENGHSQGEKNSQYGTMWIYHELIGNRKIAPELVPYYLDQGWNKGFKRCLCKTTENYAPHKFKIKSSLEYFSFPSELYAMQFFIDAKLNEYSIAADFTKIAKTLPNYVSRITTNRLQSLYRRLVL